MARAALRRQWNALLQSENGSSSSHYWIASSIAVAVSAASAAACAGDRDDDDSDRGGAAAVLLPPPRCAATRPAASIARCEPLLPYSRLSRGPTDSSSSNGESDMAFGPWQSVTSSFARKSLLHRHGSGSTNNERPMDMHEKYNIDFNTVLGEGVSL